MPATEEAPSKVLDDVFHNIRKAAETNVKMQQEFFQHWTHFWPMPTPQSVWVDKLRDFQKQCTTMISDLARKHREVIDKQYQAAVESLDAALRVIESTNPEEYRRRSEQMCRKTIDSMREISETALRELQDVAAKFMELATKAGS